MTDLKPCPFCGCLASVRMDPHAFTSGKGWRIECEGDCHAMTCWWHSEAQAIAAWNRRPDEWVSVEDIPDDQQRVIVAAPQSKSTFVGEARYSSRTGTYYRGRHKGMATQLPNVTRWQPLPEPPEKEEG